MSGSNFTALGFLLLVHNWRGSGKTPSSSVPGAKTPVLLGLKENYFSHSMNNLTYLLNDNVDGAFLGLFIGILTIRGCINIAVFF